DHTATDHVSKNLTNRSPVKDTTQNTATRNTTESTSQAAANMNTTESTPQATPAQASPDQMNNHSSDTSLVQPIVRYRNVTKAFGDHVVLKELNLDIMPGEKIALIGPSGSGKTTIARLL